MLLDHTHHTFLARLDRDGHCWRYSTPQTQARKASYGHKCYDKNECYDKHSPLSLMTVSDMQSNVRLSIDSMKQLTRLLRLADEGLECTVKTDIGGCVGKFYWSTNKVVLHFQRRLLVFGSPVQLMTFS